MWSSLLSLLPLLLVVTCFLVPFPLEALRDSEYIDSIYKEARDFLPQGIHLHTVAFACVCILVISGPLITLLAQLPDLLFHQGQRLLGLVCVDQPIGPFEIGSYGVLVAVLRLAHQAFHKSPKRVLRGRVNKVRRQPHGGAFFHVVRVERIAEVSEEAENADWFFAIEPVWLHRFACRYTFLSVQLLYHIEKTSAPGDKS